MHKVNVYRRRENVETLERLKRWRSLVTCARFHTVAIYSREHGAYWRPKGHGYTLKKSEAGRWSLITAWEMTNHCGPEKGIEYHNLK